MLSTVMTACLALMQSMALLHVAMIAMLVLLWRGEQERQLPGQFCRGLLGTPWQLDQFPWCSWTQRMACCWALCDCAHPAWTTTCDALSMT